jgi:hypothetical protein
MLDTHSLTSRANWRVVIPREAFAAAGKHKKIGPAFALQASNIRRSLAASDRSARTAPAYRSSSAGRLRDRVHTHWVPHHHSDGDDITATQLAVADLF